MNFRSKIWPRHSLRRPRFHIRQMHFHYRVTFTGYIRCFCATTSHDLVPLTFDLLTFRVFRVRCLSCLTHTPIFIILRLSVTELRLLNILSHFRYLKQSLRMRRVTWPLTGGKNSLHFWNPWPQLHTEHMWQKLWCHTRLNMQPSCVTSYMDSRISQRLHGI